MTPFGCQSITEAPFYEYIKRRPVSSRTFLTKEEQMTEALKRIKAQPVGHFLLKAQGQKARFMKAPFVPDPQLPKKRLEAAREKIFALPYYIKRSEIEAEEQRRLEHSSTTRPIMEKSHHEPRTKRTANATAELTIAKALKNKTAR